MHKSVRFKIDPRMIPAEKVARRLGITKAFFDAKRAELENAGFPKADSILGTYSLLAVDNWIDWRSGQVPVGAITDHNILMEIVRSKPWKKDKG